MRRFINIISNISRKSFGKELRSSIYCLFDYQYTIRCVYPYALQYLKKLPAMSPVCIFILMYLHANLYD
jgi:hypothetical protein